MDPRVLHAPPSVSTDEQVARALAEMIALTSVFARLADEARPQFAYRCERLCRLVRAALRQSFDGVGR